MAKAKVNDRLQPEGETFEQAVARVSGFMEVGHPIKELDGWKFGERVRVLEDDGDEGIFAGDEGVLVLEIVGSEEFHNERICASFITDGCDGGGEVDLGNIEAVD